MQSFHNIEKSGFHKGEYVGYAHGPWRITRNPVRSGKCWWTATQRDGGQVFSRRTLAEISKALNVTAEFLKSQSAA